MTAVEQPSLRRYLYLSIAAAVTTIALKSGAYLLTGSVGLLSDALESFVNLAAAIMALIMIIIAERPPDDEHAFGHNKAEYFSSGFEGALILVAAGTIAWTAIDRLLNPVPLEHIDIGLLVSLAASLINFLVAQVLMRAGKRHNSITLEADAKHLMTDVWTSVGVIVGVFLVQLTGWLPLDSIVALAVAANIIWSGYHLMQRSAMGLLDTALPKAEREKITGAIQAYETRGLVFHSVRTRQAGQRRFISMHVLVPGQWTVQAGHDELEQIERDVRHAFDGPTTVFTHLEPLEDPVSMEDIGIDRPAAGG